MPQYAVLIYADDSAHAPDATPEERPPATSTPTSW